MYLRVLRYNFLRRKSSKTTQDEPNYFLHFTKTIYKFILSGFLNVSEKNCIEGSLFLSLLLSTSLLSASPPPVSLSEKFIRTMESHLIEPSWVVPFFFNMDLNTFTVCWDLLATVIKEKSWYLLCSKPSDYSEFKYRDELIAHCKTYDPFLRGLFVDPLNNAIVFLHNQRPKAGYISIFDYWKMMEHDAVSHFYAFYFDCVGARFIEAVNNAFLNMDNKEYLQYVRDSWTHLGTLNMLFKQLVGSAYEVRYADHLKKYREVRQLLLCEHQKRSIA